MCGIFAVSKLESINVGEVILNGLKKLEYRGYDSWGISVKSKDNKVLCEKNVGKISNASISLSNGLQGIGHTRWATHGKVTKDNAHPHIYNGVHVVHNGIFENFEEEKQRLLKKGNIFVSSTDTEVIAHLISEELDKNNSPINAIKNICSIIKGRFSLIVMIEGFEGLIIGRKGSPLIIGKSEDSVYIASDIPAFLEYTHTVNYLDDNEMAVVKGTDIEYLNMDSNQLILKRDITVSWEDEIADKGDYKHFMLKEIFDQKISLASAINHSKKELFDFVKELKSGEEIYMLGCGTAHKVCMTSQYYFSMISKRKINVVPASEMTAFKHFINKKTILFAVSQSGETADILDILEYGKKVGSKILSITNVNSSSISRISDRHLPLRAGKEKAVASTKATTSQMAILLLLSYTYSDKLNEGRQILQSLVSNINDLLNPRYENYIKSISEKLVNNENIFIIGKNDLFPMALESAIKIMEVSYIHAQGFAGGEMKHGPIALIEENTPCIILGNDEETLSSAMELKSRGAKLIGVSVDNSNIFDEWIKVPESFSAKSIASIVPIQILAYYLAILKNIDPDMPRNLAKSVTVK